jgi:hypothetical protein
VNCSRCGWPVPVDAGFCRTCGAILRGQAARATLVPTAPVSGPAPPAEGPEPRPHPLADAGYFGPPGGPAGLVLHASGQLAAVPWEEGQPVARPRAPELFRSQPTEAPSSWFDRVQMGRSGKTSPESERRLRNSILALDFSLLLGAVLTFASVFMPWYQATIGPVTVTRLLLAGQAGFFRWLVPVLAGALVLEAAASLGVFLTTDRESIVHRGLGFGLAVFSLVFVVVATASSPFAPISLSGMDIGIAPAAGGYLAIAGAVVAVLAAFARMFAGRPALTRSAAIH